MDGLEAGMDLTTFDLTTFMDTAVELLAVPSTAERPEQLRRH